MFPEKWVSKHRGIAYFSSNGPLVSHTVRKLLPHQLPSWLHDLKASCWKHMDLHHSTTNIQTMSDTILGQIASRWPLGWPSHISKPRQKQEQNCWTEPMLEWWANKWLLFYTLNFGGVLLYKNRYQWGGE